MCKEEFVSDEIGYLAEEISQQSVKGVDWFPLLVRVKYKRKEIEERTVLQKGTRI
jgi:hypothetical protein